VGLALVSLAEMVAMVWIFRVKVRFPYPAISIFQASWMTVVMAILITACGALLAGVTLQLLDGTDMWAVFPHWWAADALGTCVLVPPIILFSRAELARLARPAHLGSNLLGIPICVAVTFVAIKYLSHPFVVIAMAPMLAAFQVGAFGTSILSAFNSLFVIALWVCGVRPAGVDANAADAALAGLPFVALIAATMPPIAVGLGTDARRRVTRTLRSSERRFRESMEHSPLGVILLDRNGRWTFSNTALQEMLGYTGKELSRMDIRALAHPDEIGDIWENWGRLLKGEIDSYKINRRLRRSDGSWLWVHCAVSLARDENEVPMHFIAHVESLEERRYAAARLAKEREFLRITLDSIGDSVLTADARGRVTYMNHSAEGLIGRTLAAAAGRHLREVLPLVPADGTGTAPDIIERCRDEGSFVKRDEPCSLVRPDGSVCFVSDAATPVIDADGELNGFVVVLHDVTLNLARTRELHHRADHDALTGLLNRAAFERSLHQSFALAHGMGTHSALVVVDLDRFKAVNDAGGHAAGDAVLRHVAAVMRRSVRPSDVVGRLGGDEFAVLLNDCDPERAMVIATRLRDALNPLVTTFEGKDHDIGASLGMAYSGHDQSDPDDWARAADQACYEVKRTGRGRLKIFGPPAPTLAAQRGRS
jgi:diguanylate cyclase (GGDEF)-like protein/PAS domain S-box-containing protein